MAAASSGTQRAIAVLRSEHSAKTSA